MATHKAVSFLAPFQVPRPKLTKNCALIKSLDDQHRWINHDREKHPCEWVRNTATDWEADVDPEHRAININPHEGSNWRDFDTVRKRLIAFDQRSEYGIGFVLVRGTNLTVIDIDYPKESNPTPERIATFEIIRDRILAQFPDTYAETSLSGHGVHIWVLGQTANAKSSIDGVTVEVYSGERYMTVTGDFLADRNVHPKMHQEALTALYEELSSSTLPKAGIEVAARKGRELSKAESGRYAALMTGKWQSSYQSQSEADLALCRLLSIKHGTDVEKIDEEFRQGGLYRPKWDRDDYRESTIKAAIASAWVSSVEPPTHIPNRSMVTISRLDDPMPEMPIDFDHTEKNPAPEMNPLPAEPPKHEVDPNTGEIVKLDRRKLVYAPWEMEEMNMAATRWLIDGLLPEVGTSLISAGPKTGKGTLARQMAIAVAEGTKFLDRETRKGTVLYCSRQEKLGELIRLFKKANRGKVPEVYISPVEALQLGAKTPLDAIRQLVMETLKQNKGNPIRLVCLDMLTSWFKMSDSNQYSETFDVLEPLQSLAVELDTHICVIHHANKSATPDLLDVRSVMGSGAIAGSVDQVILLSNDPSTERRVITTVQRTGEGLPKHWLNWDSDSKTVTLGDPWNRTGSTTVNTDTEKAILQFVEENPRCSRNKLFAGVPGNEKRLRRILDGLIEKGTVQELSSGRAGTANSLVIAGELTPVLIPERVA